MSVERLFATEAIEVPQVHVVVKGGGGPNAEEGGRDYARHFQPLIHSILRTDDEIIYQCRALHFDRRREKVEVCFAFDGFERSDTYDGGYESGEQFIAILRLRKPECPWTIELNTFRN